ncbi:hypothetical protein [Streptomyces sp. NBC_01268]|uniref:hypothetical protein n=1 Tax=Streptomyces sp. NBC_01268 TaxID=2903806 RepID=UPI002E3266D9|nr:hypothetical protein [Streptomyces sp. NBC_01268]
MSQVSPRTFKITATAASPSSVSRPRYSSSIGLYRLGGLRIGCLPARVAAEHGYPRPNASAQSFPFAPTDVRYVRVTGTKLRQDPRGNFHLQLAEIEAAGEELAANRPVSTSSSIEGSGWKRTAAPSPTSTATRGPAPPPGPSRSRIPRPAT